MRETRVIIGITGSIASGKSSVASYLASLGANTPIYDADKQNHLLLRHNTDVIHSIIQEFGASVLNEQGEISRIFLSKTLSEQPEKLLLLEHIIHPALKKEREKFIIQHQSRPYVILDVPLLFEANIDKECSITLCTYCDETTRKERAFMRGNMSDDKWQYINNRQMPQHDKVKRADYSIDTNGALDDTYKQIRNIYCRLNIDSLK